MAEPFEYAIKKDVRNNPIVREVDETRQRELWKSVAVAGFLVVGLALSAVVPVAMSVAGDLAPGRAGGAISVVTTLGYGGFLLGPVIVGGLAEVFGLRVALGTIAVSGLLIFDSIRKLPS